MGGNNTVATFTASLIEYGRRKKAIKQINKTNENNRRIVKIGKVNVETLLPKYETLGNVCISGGGVLARRELISQCIDQAVSVGMPTVILHEGNSHIEYDLRNNYSNHSYVRVINASEPFYDPIIRHNDIDIANIIYNASKDEIEIPVEGHEYVKSVSKVCRKQGVTPYVRMIGDCPFERLDEIVTLLGNKCILSDKEMVLMCESINKSSSARGSVEMFMSALCSEGSVLAWKSNLSKSTSIEECVKANGIISIDVESFEKKALIGLLVAELNYCKQYGKEIRLIIDGRTIESNDTLIKTMKTSSGSITWAMVCPDMKNMIGAQDFSTWIALSHKVFILKNGLKAAEAFSKELGEYDRIDYSQTKSGGINYGRFGLQMGDNGGLTTSMKREVIVKAEEITSFNDKEFLVLNNNTAVLQHGIIV